MDKIMLVPREGNTAIEATLTEGQSIQWEVCMDDDPKNESAHWMTVPTGPSTSANPDLFRYRIIDKWNYLN